MAETIIYTKPGCPYCAAELDDLRARKVFGQVDLRFSSLMYTLTRLWGHAWGHARSV